MLKKGFLIILLLLISSNVYSEDVLNRVIFQFGNTVYPMQTFRNIEEPIVIIDSINEEEDRITWGFIDGIKIVTFYSYIVNLTEFRNYDYYFRLTGRKFIYDSNEYKIDHVEIIIQDSDGQEFNGMMHESIGEGTASSQITIVKWLNSHLSDYQIISIESEHYRDTMF